MMLFRLRADATFYADDIDDAMSKLADHFRAVGSGELPEDSPFTSGGVDVRPATVYPNAEAGALR